VTHEPMPVETNISFPVQDDALQLFIDVFTEQKLRGEVKYGTPLMAFNGRSAFNDLFQELADAVAYAMQLHMEHMYLKIRNTWLEKEVKRLNGLSVESNRKENSSLA
jgi:hypothetical protein